MSPIIEQQRRLVEVGRIRLGDQVSYEQGGETKRRAHKLDKFRLTSRDEVRIRAAAKEWGGEPRPWEQRPGEWELYTTVDTLPIMLIPNTEPSLWYELWSGGGCLRRCDGVSEQLSDGPCLCEPEQRECKPHLRFPVLLPHIAGIGSWLVTSTGWNAANEIPGTYALLQRLTDQGVLVPARLRLEQRTDKKGGQTRKYVVPVIDIDITVRELVYGQQAVDGKALPAGYTPIAQPDAPPRSLAEAIGETEGQELRRTDRTPPPIPPSGFVPGEVADDPLEVYVEAQARHIESEGDEPAPAASLLDQPAPAPADEPLPEPAKKLDQKPTGPQLKKLNLLVGKLREPCVATESGDLVPAVLTEQLWAAAAKRRNVDVEVMIELLQGRDEAGVLHWSPLRDSMTRIEASDLIESLEARVKQYNVEVQ